VVPVERMINRKNEKKRRGGKRREKERKRSRGKFGGYR
jgi:hypothetical protein